MGEDILLEEGETTESEEEVQKKRPRFTEDQELDSLISQVVPPNNLQNASANDDNLAAAQEEQAVLPSLLRGDAAKWGSKSQE